MVLRVFFVITLFIATLLVAITAGAVLNEVDKQSFLGKNLLVNGGAENGKAGWSETDADADTLFLLATSEASTAQFMSIGKANIAWDPEDTVDVLLMPSFTMTSGYAGRDMVYSCLFSGASTQAASVPLTFDVHDGSAAVVSTSVLDNVQTMVRYSLNFIAGAAGTVYRGRLTPSNGPSTTYMRIDDCWLGPASEFNLTNISQASFIGSAYIAVTANCSPNRTSTSLGAFGTDADCPGPTVELNPGPGTIQTTDANGAIFTVNNLPPGYYEARMCGNALKVTTNQYSSFAINDGTTTSGSGGGTGSTATTSSGFCVHGHFTYTNAGNRTFELYGSSESGRLDLLIGTGNSNLTFSLKRFPLSSEQAYRPDASAMSWSGYHDSTCSWARTNTAYGDPTADATCTLTEKTNVNFGTVTSAESGGNKLPGIVFTPSRAGRYHLCVNFQIDGSVNLQKVAVLDGSTEVAYAAHSTSSYAGQSGTCAVITASDTTAKTIKLQTASPTGSVTLGPASTTTANVMWSIFAIDQQLPAPLLVNSVVSPMSGVTNICYGYITNAGVPAVTRSSGNCVTAASDDGTGVSTLTFASGTFSAVPSCTCTAASGASGNSRICSTEVTTNSTSTSVTFGVYTGSTNAATDADFSFDCKGSK